MPKGPYISFVLAGRNDNYGGDFQQRLQNCISSLHRQLTAFQIPSEILFVNYNPLPAPEITTFIDWPSSKGQISVKIIEVPGQLHADFVNQHGLHKVPMIEYLAKNTGIRRCAGEFIACINPDVYLPDELFRKIRKGLDQRFYYKANRLDVNLDENQAIKSYVRMNLKGHAFPVNSFSAFKNLAWKLKYGILNYYKFISPRFKYIFDILKITVYYHHVEFKYHCIAGGDLMLMSRSTWLSLKGYHEKNAVALHTDSLMTIQAASAGLKEHVLNAPVIHQEHERRFTSDRNDEVQENAYLFFQQEAEWMLAQKKNRIYNTDDWGFIKFELPEITVK